MVPQKLGGFAFQKPSTMPILLKAGFEEISRDHPLTIRIPSLVFPAAAGLAIDRKKAKEADLEVTELANSGKKSYAVQAAPSGQESKLPAVLDLRDLHDPSARKDGFIDPQPLAVLIEGAFPFIYRDRDVPAWKE
jgi:hypothetical protein